MRESGDIGKLSKISLKLKQAYSLFLKQVTGITFYTFTVDLEHSCQNSKGIFNIFSLPNSLEGIHEYGTSLLRHVISQFPPCLLLSFALS